MKTTNLKFLLLACALGFSISIQAAIFYVAPAGAGTKNGANWANAAPGENLQMVIDQANSGDQVWVACGTYFTTIGTDRNSAFHMKAGVDILGSFAGTESQLNDRVMSCGPCSILSGEIGTASKADNSYHVISNGPGLSSSAVINAFVIEGANDDRSPTLTEGLGGGIYNDGGNTGNSCNPTISTCIIRNNFARFGAGIFNSGHSGGDASPFIVNCVITGNTAYLGGGGIDNFGLGGKASPAITNTLVYANVALDRAGGMYCWGGNNGEASPKIVNSVFVNNTAIDGGGIVADRENSPPGSQSGNSDPVLVNSIFRSNVASGTGPQFFLIGGATCEATYSSVDLAGQTLPHVMNGSQATNVIGDPLFVNIANAIGPDNCWFTADDGLNLQTGSPAINNGLDSVAPAFDIQGKPRVGKADIGAYEKQAPTQLKKWNASMFSIYPNPAKDVYTVNFADNLEHSLSVYDMLGNLVYKGSCSGTTTLSSATWKAGVYIVRIDSQAVKLIKQ